MSELPDIGEQRGSPTLSVSENGIEGQRIFKCKWEDALEFCQALGEDAEFVLLPSAILSQIRVDPWPGTCPKSRTAEDAETLIANANAYDFAQITAIYSIGDSSAGQSGSNSERPHRFTKQKNEDGTEFSVEVDTTLQIFTIKGSGLGWQYHSVPIGDTEEVNRKVLSDNEAFFQYPTSEIRLRWSKVEEPNFNAIDKMLGSVNQNSYTVPVTSIICPPETLLFEGFSSSVKFDATSILDPAFLWSIDMVFRKKHIIGHPVWTSATTSVASDATTNIIGWNHLYRDDVKKGWERVFIYEDKVDDDPVLTKPLYPLNAWTGMFTQVSS